MKTIEEASGDYTHKNYGKRKVDTYIHEAFKAGVEFAQRWIPVEEELPEENSFVIVAKKNGIKLGMFVNNRGEFLDGMRNMTSQVTHWRPIEYK